MNQLGLNPEQQQIRDMVREFVQNEIIPARRDPRVLEAFEPNLPKKLYAALSDLGLHYLTLSEEAGGPGVDELTFCVVAEELARGDAGLAVQFCQTAAICGAVFNRLADKAQRDAWAAELIEYEEGFLAVAGGAVEYKGLGSDFFNPDFPSDEAVQVRRHGDGWVLDGEIVSVDGAPTAKRLIVRAQDEDSDLRYFYIPADREGIIITKREKESPTSLDYYSATTSWKHGTHGAVIFSNCAVAETEELKFAGEAPSELGFGGAHTWRDAISLGVARAAFEEAATYSTIRVQGGKPIGQHEAVGMLLANMAVKLEAARLLVWQAACTEKMVAEGAEATLFTSAAREIATAFVSEAVKEIALDSAETFGAMGVMRDMPIAALVRDSLICSVGGLGADQSLRLIGRAIERYCAE